MSDYEIWISYCGHWPWSTKRCWDPRIFGVVHHGTTMGAHEYMWHPSPIGPMPSYYRRHRVCIGYHGGVALPAGRCGSCLGRWEQKKQWCKRTDGRRA